jgi:hypothetical protein
VFSDLQIEKYGFQRHVDWVLNFEDFPEVAKAGVMAHIRAEEKREMLGKRKQEFDMQGGDKFVL